MEHLGALPHQTLSDKAQTKMRSIIKIYEQQHGKMYGQIKEIKDRIVSLSKPYIRPIIRGKETKTVEFGARVNILQVDEINFIEHLSYDAFHEGNRLQSGIHLQRNFLASARINEPIRSMLPTQTATTAQKIIFPPILFPQANKNCSTSNRPLLSS